MISGNNKRSKQSSRYEEIIKRVKNNEDKYKTFLSNGHR